MAYASDLAVPSGRGWWGAERPELCWARHAPESTSTPSPASLLPQRLLVSWRVYVSTIGVTQVHLTIVPPPAGRFWPRTQGSGQTSPGATRSHAARARAPAAR
jgi:hypothetical protein